MSELTPCNFCSLERIKKDAAEKGADVAVSQLTFRSATGDLEGYAGWYVVERTDVADPVALFMSLTAGCAC